MAAKTKLEAAKDMITAINGMTEAASSVYENCIHNFDEDYGMYQVLALLRLTGEELETLIDYLEVRR